MQVSFDQSEGQVSLDGTTLSVNLGIECLSEESRE